MSLGYMPIEILKGFRHDLGREIKNSSKICLSDLMFRNLEVFGVEHNNITSEEWLRFFLNPQSYMSMPIPQGDDNYKFNAPFLTLSTLLKEISPKVKALEHIGEGDKEQFQAFSNFTTEFKDAFCLPILLSDFEKSKQVYRVSPIFGKTLLHTSKLTIYKQSLTKLPCDSFYLDLTLCPYFRPYEGAFVFIRECGEYISFTITICARDNKEYVFWSSYNMFEFNNSGELSIDMKEATISFNDTDVSTYYYSLNDGKEERCSFDNGKSSLGEITTFALQTVNYLCSENPDIIKDNTHAHTRRNKQNIKRVSLTPTTIDLVRYDYGTSYDNEIKKTYSKYINPKTFEVEIPTEIINANLPEGRKRKSPNPYFRRAHWHTYRCGKDKADTVMHWRKPEFVGGNVAKNISIKTI